MTKIKGRNHVKALTLNTRHLITPDEGWNSTKEIRKWRSTLIWIKSK